ncbi:MAG: hypothetical protein CMI02_17480 [Oceanospirillaceae bacterium]|nr:hypothetical protein [Oceanospirillaceae bacterium]MBT13815.1 hypothetical protein [Oceanospirillaceae bacterium]|tara:strand:- start:19038 stop:19544 length:507 start_codon:yes stop_codon:yes gene_type:complete
MTPSDSKNAKTWAARFRSPVFIGFTWFILASVISQGAFELSNIALSEDLAISEPLFAISEAVAFPAPMVYNAVNREKTQKALTLYLQEHPESDKFSQLNGQLDNLSNDEVWNVTDELYNENYDVEITKPEEYTIYLGSCAFTGLIIALLAFFTFHVPGNASTSRISRD